MNARNDKRKGAGFNAPKWWLKIVRAKLEPFGTAAQISRDLNVKEATVSRCKDGETTTIEFVQRLSWHLKIPRPVFVPNSYDEATAIEDKLKERKIAMGDLSDITPADYIPIPEEDE